MRSKTFRQFIHPRWPVYNQALETNLLCCMDLDLSSIHEESHVAALEKSSIEENIVTFSMKMWDITLVTKLFCAVQKKYGLASRWIRLFLYN